MCLALFEFHLQQIIPAILEAPLSKCHYRKRPPKFVHCSAHMVRMNERNERQVLPYVYVRLHSSLHSLYSIYLIPHFQSYQSQ